MPHTPLKFLVIRAFWSAALFSVSLFATLFLDLPELFSPGKIDDYFTAINGFIWLFPLIFGWNTAWAIKSYLMTKKRIAKGGQHTYL